MGKHNYTEEELQELIDKLGFDPTRTNEDCISEMNQRMSQVLEMSPTMCTAKWLQTTIMLQNGYTHSCHHPVAHKIPLREIKNNPSALHNTKHKKKQRKMMLKGKRPPECVYCWNIEDLEEQHYSDRTYKSADPHWSMPYLDKVVEAGHKKNVNPSYLEVAFENTCNFKCVYCTPDVSSKWMEEVKTHGRIELTDMGIHDLDYMKKIEKFPYDRDQHNPYVEAFWEWWPELYPALHTFRITGGEPLLTKNTWRVLDEVEKNPRKDFNLAINTNMGVHEKLVDRLIGYAQRLEGKIRTFSVYTSLESIGAQAEYTRHGLNQELFLSNVHRFLKNTKCDVNFMVTFNALSVPSFEEFLRSVFLMRQDFNKIDFHNRIPFMVAYLRWPTQLDCRILPDELKRHYANKYREFADSHTKYAIPGQPGRIYLEEVDQIKRLADHMETPVEDLQTRRRDFALFIRQIDQRRNLNFTETFPELADFYRECEGLI